MLFWPLLAAGSVPALTAQNRIRLTGAGTDRAPVAWPFANGTEVVAAGAPAALYQVTVNVPAPALSDRMVTFADDAPLTPQTGETATRETCSTGAGGTLVVTDGLGDGAVVVFDALGLGFFVGELLGDALGEADGLALAEGEAEGEADGESGADGLGEPPPARRSRRWWSPPARRGRWCRWRRTPRRRRHRRGRRRPGRGRPPR